MDCKPSTALLPRTSRCKRDRPADCRGGRSWTTRRTAPTRRGVRGRVPIKIRGRQRYQLPWRMVMSQGPAGQSLGTKRQVPGWSSSSVEAARVRGLEMSVMLRASTVISEAARRVGRKVSWLWRGLRRRPLLAHDALGLLQGLAPSAGQTALPRPGPPPPAKTAHAPATMDPKTAFSIRLVLYMKKTI